MKVYGTIEDSRTEKPLKGGIVTLTAGDTTLIENTPATDGSFYYNIPSSAVPIDEDVLTCTVTRNGYKTQTSSYKMTGQDIEIAIELIPDPIDWPRIFRTVGIVLAVLLLIVIIIFAVNYFFFGPQPPSVVIKNFKVEPALISAGDKVVITWDVRNAGEVSLGEEKVEPFGTQEVEPEITTKYTLTAQGKDGDPLKRAREVTVLPPPRILRFAATPSEIQQWDSSLLEWQTENAESLYIISGEEDEKTTAEAVEGAGKVAGKKIDTQKDSIDATDSGTEEVPVKKRDLNGSAEVFPLDTTTYTLVAVNRLGVKSVAGIEVKVLLPPEILSFTSSSSSLKEGSTAILKWKTKAATQVFLNDEQTGHNYSMEVVPLETTKYTLKVRNKVGERQRVLTIKVPKPETKPGDPVKPKPPPPPPEINRFHINQPEIAAGQSSVIRWATQHAASVYLNGKQVQPFGEEDVLPGRTTKYELKAVNETGEVTWIRTIEVLSAPCTVILYEYENYRGDSIAFSIDSPKLGRLDNKVSSIRIIGNCRAKVYSAPNYKATRQEFNASVSRLRGSWIGNNNVSSVKIIKQ
ncbi:MAG: hypothetical protein GY940_17825 [bacterium]|nr:hypothetical protein [bacterium]